MPTSYHPKTDAHARAQYVIAGTLYLMSCFVQHRLPLYAERIAKNLQLLGGDRSLTAEMRTLCERLAHHRDASLACDVQSRLLALAQRRDAAIDLRLTAGAIVLEPNSLIGRPR